jgi:hypothetical protein
MKLRSLLSIVLIAIAAPSHAAWIAGMDFVANETPDGAQELINPNPTVPEWSYGFRSTLLSTDLTLFTSGNHTNAAGGNEPMEGFQNGAEVLANVSGSDFTIVTGFGPITALPSQDMYLHPSSGNDYAIVRWTTPTTGSYEINSFWQDLDT